MISRFSGRIRHLASVVCVALAASAPSVAGAQSTCVVSVEGLHWCDNPITFSFEGGDWLNALSGGLVMRAAVSYAVEQINFLVSQGIDLHMSEVAAGTGSLRLFFLPIGNHPESGNPLLGRWTPAVGAGGTYLGGTLEFNSAQLGLASSFSRETVALHELMHALGLGGAHGTCSGDTLMLESLGPGIVRTTIDPTATDALSCIYGNQIFPVCGQIDGLWIRTGPRVPGGISITKGTCDGCGPSCGSSIAGQLASMATSSSVEYELSISEAGGPFVVVATLSESDFVSGVYDYVPTVDHSVALLRLDRIDGGSMTGRAQTWDPIHITGVPISVPIFGPGWILLLASVLCACGTWLARRQKPSSRRIVG